MVRKESGNAEKVSSLSYPSVGAIIERRAYFCPRTGEVRSDMNCNSSSARETVIRALGPLLDYAAVMNIGAGALAWQGSGIGGLRHCR